MTIWLQEPEYGQCWKEDAKLFQPDKVFIQRHVLVMRTSKK